LAHGTRIVKKTHPAYGTRIVVKTNPGSWNNESKEELPGA
jgi:hypothetical protein